MTMEENYLRHCLELFHTSAMTANSWPISSLRVVSGGNGGHDAFTTVINLLNSPLSCQLSASNDDISNGNASAIEVRESIRVSSSHDIQKKRVLPEDQIFGCSPMHKRIVTHTPPFRILLLLYRHHHLLVATFKECFTAYGIMDFHAMFSL
ncbi:hypothetical protein Tco_0560787 [Tanacetum coccineum]